MDRLARSKQGRSRYWLSGAEELAARLAPQVEDPGRRRAFIAGRFRRPRLRLQPTGRTGSRFEPGARNGQSSVAAEVRRALPDESRSSRAWRGTEVHTAYLSGQTV